MPLFQLALQKPAAGAGLQDTMGAPTPDLNSPTASDDAIKAAEKRLESILSEQPDINYEEKFSGLMADIQKRQVPEHPLSTPAGALTSFAYALGAPNTAPALLHEKIQRTQDAVAQKERDLMSMKEAILHGSIQQEIAKGNFKTALKQSEALAELERATADRKREMDLRVWKEQQTQRAADAEKLVHTRVKALAADFHLDEKKQLILFSKAMDYRDMLTRQPGLIPGTGRYEDDQINQMVDQFIQNYAAQLGTIEKPGGKGTTAPLTPPENDKQKQAADILKNLRTKK